MLKTTRHRIIAGAGVACVILAALALALLLRPGSARAADVKYPESADGLHKLATDLLAAVKDRRNADASVIAGSLVLADHDAWFVRTFGEEKGKELAGIYAKTSATLERDVVKLFEDQLGRNRTTIRTYKLDDPDDKRGTGAQRSALAAMKQKTALYGVRLTEPDKDSGMHVWSFVYVDGSFRLAGKMY